jgi:hypothetical protein
MKNEKQSAAARAVIIYFRAAIGILLLTAVGAGLLLAESGSLRTEGLQPENIAVLSSGDRKISLIFPYEEKAMDLRLPRHTVLLEMLPPPLGNAVWFVRSITEAARVTQTSEQ